MPEDGVKREMKRRYPGRVYNTQAEADQYKGLVKEKGLEYEVQEHDGLFYVDEPRKSHIYWRRKP